MRLDESTIVREIPSPNDTFQELCRAVENLQDNGIGADPSVLASAIDNHLRAIVIDWHRKQFDTARSEGTEQFLSGVDSA